MSVQRVTISVKALAQTLWDPTVALALLATPSPAMASAA